MPEQLFLGHVMGAVFFVFYACWSIIDTIKYYFYTAGNDFRSSLYRTIPMCKGRRRVALLPLILTGAASVLIIIQVIVIPLLRGKSTPAMQNLQHTMMYVYLALSGALMIILDNCKTFPLKRQVEYASFILALTVEVLLFKFHLQGREDHDAMIHWLLIYVVSANIMAALFEAVFDRSVCLPLIRSYLMLLQGTWLIQMGFTLYNPWHERTAHAHTTTTTAKDMEMEMKLVSIFCCHVGVLFVGLILVLVFAHRTSGGGRKAIRATENGLSGDDDVCLYQMLDTEDKPTI